MSWPRPRLSPGMTGSPWDYDYCQVTSAQLLAQTWHSLVIAAMIRADSSDRRRLIAAFPEIAADLRARGHLEMAPADPANRPPVGDNDIREQCQDCGDSLFGVFYDPRAQGRYVACISCGTSAGLR